MEINKEIVGDILTVKIKGSLDINTAPGLSKTLKGALDNVKEVVFDLGDSDYTSSAGLRVLLETYQIMDKKKGKMLIKNVCDALYDTLKLSGFTDFIDIHKKEN